MCCNYLGEEVLKTVGSFLVVELMRQGKTPQQACEEAILRILNKPNKNYKDFQKEYCKKLVLKKMILHFQKCI